MYVFDSVWGGSPSFSPVVYDAIRTNSKISFSDQISEYEETNVGEDTFVLTGITVVTIAGPVLYTTDAKFQALRQQWREQRGISSSAIDIILCEAYQSIIGLGPQVLPSVFSQLRSEGNKPDHWFWALKMITQQEPVPEELRGNRREAARHWLQWAEQNGYLVR